MTFAAWCAPADLPPGLPGTEEEWQEWCLIASQQLYALSGRRWAGVTTATTVEMVAPATDPQWPFDAHSTGGYPAAPVLVAGEIRNCRTFDPPLLRLPDYPVVAVTAVTVGGTLRDPASYRLVGHRYLEDRTGTGWPTAPPGAVITYDYGQPPPPSGLRAAAALAAELIKAANGADTALPGNVTSITRQGVTIGQRPAADLFDKGYTGLPSVDMWLATVNPRKLARAARAWSPDTEARSYRQEAL